MLSSQQIQQIYQINQIHYKSISEKIVNSPNQHRKCTNSFFTLLLIFTLVTFFGIGVYSIVQLKIKSTELSLLTDGEEEFSITDQYEFIIIGVAASILIALSIIILIKVLEKAAIFFVALLSLLSIASSSIAGFILSNITLGFSMGVLFMIYLFLIIKMKRKVDIGITFIKTSSYFINQNRYIILLPLIKLVFIGLTAFFFIGSISNLGTLIEQNSQEGRSKILLLILIVIQSCIQLVLIFFFYYCMTYLISSLSVNWYYGIKGVQSIPKLYISMFQHAGTLFFGSLAILLLPFIKMILFTRKYMDRKTNKEKRIHQSNNTSIITVLSKFVSCFFSCLVSTSLCFIRLFFQNVEGILNVINHYTIIMISLTGQGYLQGAMSVVGLTHKECDLMELNNTICNYLITWGLSLSVGVPSILVYFLMGNSLDVTEAQRFYTTIIIAICCTMVSIIFLEILVTSISSIYILYQFDKDLVERKLIKHERLQRQTYYEINRCSKNPYFTQSRTIQICEGDYYALNS